MKPRISRRGFIKTGAAASVVGSKGPSVLEKGAKKGVRLGFIGVGGRGTGLLRNCLLMDDVEIPAICDVTEKNLERAQQLVVNSGRSKPEGYSGAEDAYLEFVDRDDLDGVVIATPWELHIPMAIAVMKAGKYAAPEVGGASSVEECWDLVKTSEATGVPCMILENGCYRRDNMAILNMVREGLFGELLHCQGGYQHDLQERVVMGKGTGVVLPEGGDYRTRQNRMRNASLYPTHGVGPIANLLNIDRGNRFSFLVSVASKSRGLSDWSRENLEPGHRFADIDWAHGDVVTTVIKCVNGETIVLDHDVQLPRARTHNKRVQGTRGIWMGDMNSIYLEGRSAGHKWESFDRYLTEFDHPLWRRYEQEGVSDTGHGGIDFLVIRAFKETVKRRTSPPLDVYDTASWMAISPLSEQSIVLGSQPVAFPDFTNGKWMYKHQPIFGFGAEY